MKGEDAFRTGMAMLADPAAAKNWRQAIELVVGAASEGHPDAIERRAVFECIGIAGSPDWEKAMASLAHAAERGSASAAGQLDALKGKSIAERLAAPPARSLSANPLIRTIESFADAAECRWLIDRASGRLERATIYTRVTGQSGIDPGRTNQHALFDFTQIDVVVELIRSRIATAISAPMPCLEISQVLRYSPGEEFLPHCDYLDPQIMAGEIGQRGQRAVTVLIYLNDAFEGGETSFPALGIEHRGRAGDAILFSNLNPAGKPEPRTIHAGRPPTSGQKWLFSQWVRDRIPN